MGSLENMQKTRDRKPCFCPRKAKYYFNGIYEKFLLVKLALCWEFLGTAEAGVDGLVVVISLQVHQHCLVFTQPCLGKITQQLAVFIATVFRGKGSLSVSGTFL
jgi:hypothetical protein